MISESTFLLWIAIWTGLGLCTFVLLQFVTAPFGRHSRSDWGPTLPNRLAWIVMEFPPVSLFPLLFFVGPTGKTSLHYLFFALYFGHYLYRDLVYPFRIRTSGKRMPWAVCASGLFFNLVNASILGGWLGWFAHFDPSWWTSPQLIGGLTLFFVGFALHFHSDHILIGLRDGNDTGYKIPDGRGLSLGLLPESPGRDPAVDRLRPRRLAPRGPELRRLDRRESAAARRRSSRVVRERVSRVSARAEGGIARDLVRAALPTVPHMRDLWPA